jgi:hypothetical protein
METVLPSFFRRTTEARRRRGEREWEISGRSNGGGLTLSCISVVPYPFPLLHVSVVFFNRKSI